MLLSKDFQHLSLDLVCCPIIADVAIDWGVGRDLVPLLRSELLKQVCHTLTSHQSQRSILILLLELVRHLPVKSLLSLLFFFLGERLGLLVGKLEGFVHLFAIATFDVLLRLELEHSV